MIEGVVQYTANVWMMLMVVDDGVVQFTASVLMVVDDSEWFSIQPVCG